MSRFWAGASSGSDDSGSDSDKSSDDDQAAKKKLTENRWAAESDSGKKLIYILVSIMLCFSLKQRLLIRLGRGKS
jgi:hypothetical protein